VGIASYIIRTVMHAVPFFQTDSLPTHARARLLLLSYHFPPSQSVGALRWEKLAQYAAERGWGMDVITLDPSSQRAPDASRMDGLPRGVRVYGIPAAELGTDRLENAVWEWWRGRRSPSRAAEADAPATHPRPSRRVASFARHDVHWIPRRSRDVLRAYYAVLDYRRSDRWARQATELSLRLIEPHVHRAVITSGPPHMVHAGGCRLASATGLPLVMDLRDPWSFVQRLPEGIAHPIWWQLAARHERRAVSRAALVVTNTELAHREMARRYPERYEQIICVMNGYDTEPIPLGEVRQRFTMAYAGSIYLDRDPQLLFRAAGRVIRELSLSPAEFGIDLIGNVSGYDGVSIGDMARHEGIERYVTAGPTRPRREAMEFLARAAMLVSLPQDSDMAIPAKVFEYMRFDAWLLALAEPGSATGLLLAGTGADVVEPHDVDAMTAVLRQRYLEHARGVRPRPIARDERFSRRNQAAILFDAIEARVGPPHAPAAVGRGTGVEAASGANV
jgi:glycosyltransferase involved in cell wall biosynthesis